MKKLILTLALMLSTSAYSQLAPKPQPINLHLNSKDILDNSKDVRVGPLLMLGGGAFIAAGLLTPPVYYGGSTTNKKPFIQQGSRSFSIITGIVVSTIGIGVTLGGR